MKPTSIRRNRFAWGCGALLLFAIGAAWWAQRPSYLELPIPVKCAPHLKSFWTETQFTQAHYADTWGALDICRKTGHAYGEFPGWKTSTDVMTYFHGWLQGHGWHYLAGTSLNSSVLPEGRLLPQHTQFRLYGRTPGRAWEGPWVAVAIDPVYEGAFDVTLITVQPSWLRELDQSFD